VITDDSAGSSHSISLTGTGADFEVGSGSGSSTTQTVTAGQAATYNLMLASSGGFSGSVSLQCTGAPQYASCLVTPSSVNLSSGASSSVTVTISTSQTTTSAALRNFEFTSSTLVFVSGVLLLAPRRKANVRRVPSMILCTALIGLAGATLSSCGGGGATKTPTPTSVTHTVAPGTYTLQLAQSSGTTQKATPLTLIVK
jgi:hypothetical protein